MSEQQGDYKAKKKGQKFMGFPLPQQNFSKLPHAFIDCLSMIDSMAEMKVVIYLLRHTWGFSEYGKPKKITTDEFMNGRKRRDGSRMDKGTGMSKGSVITGLEKAVEHGFVLVERDETDKARIEKHYCLNISDVQDLDTEGQDLDSDGPKVVHRSEKETKERKGRKEKTPPALDFKNMTVGEARKLPSLRLYTDAAGYFPGSIVWEYVHNTITQNNLTFEKIQAAAVEWGARGYKPSNVKGVLEWAINGIPNGKTPAPSKDAPHPEYQPVQPDPNRGKYVPRPSHIKPNLRPASQTGD